MEGQGCRALQVSMGRKGRGFVSTFCQIHQTYCVLPQSSVRDVAEDRMEKPLLLWGRGAGHDTAVQALLLSAGWEQNQAPASQKPDPPLTPWLAPRGTGHEELVKRKTRVAVPCAPLPESPGH